MREPQRADHLNGLAQTAWEIAEESGWHAVRPGDPLRCPALAGYTPMHLLANLALIHSEVSEALEAVRKDPPHIGEELADVIIRVAELAHMLHIDLDAVVYAKQLKNRQRLDVPARGGATTI